MINMEVLGQAFTLMGFGMAGVFVVLCLFYATVKILGAFGRNKSKK